MKRITVLLLGLVLLLNCSKNKKDTWRLVYSDNGEEHWFHTSPITVTFFPKAAVVTCEGKFAQVEGDEWGLIKTIGIGVLTTQTAVIGRIDDTTDIILKEFKIPTEMEKALKELPSHHPSIKFLQQVRGVVRSHTNTSEDAKTST